MVISSQEGVSCGVESQMEETHSLPLLSRADNCHQHTERNKQQIHTKRVFR